jgi:hypothetical protein
MRLRLILMAATACLLAVGSATGAELGPYAGFAVGYGMSSVDNGQIADGGPDVGMRLGYDFANAGAIIAFEGQFLAKFNAGSVQSASEFSTFANGAAHGPPLLFRTPPYTLSAVSDWQTDLAVKFGIPVRGITTYLIGGMSVIDDRQHLSRAAVTGSGGNITRGDAQAVSVSGSTIHFGLVGGIGADVPIMPSLSAFAEARYHDYFGAAYQFSNGASATEPMASGDIETGLDWHF